MSCLGLPGENMPQCGDRLDIKMESLQEVCRMLDGATKDAWVE